MPAAGVAVEEAVLAQVVVDAPQALVPVGELIRHALWLLWDTVITHFVFTQIEILTNTPGNVSEF